MSHQPDIRDRESDILDQASQLTSLLVDYEIANRQAAAAPQQVPDEHGVFAITHCVEEDCEAPLPEARIKAGYIRCVECVERAEHERRVQYGRKRP